MPVHFLKFLFKWKGVKATYIIKYVVTEIYNSTPHKKKKKVERDPHINLKTKHGV